MRVISREVSRSTLSAGRLVTIWSIQRDWLGRRHYCFQVRWLLECWASSIVATLRWFS